MLGAMSRIDRDVPPYMLVEGNPARVRSLNLVGLRRAGMADQEKCSQPSKAFRILFCTAKSSPRTSRPAVG